MGVIKGCTNYRVHLHLTKFPREAGYALRAPAWERALEFGGQTLQRCHCRKVETPAFNLAVYPAFKLR